MPDQASLAIGAMVWEIPMIVGTRGNVGEHSGGCSNPAVMERQTKERERDKTAMLEYRNNLF